MIYQSIPQTILSLTAANIFSVRILWTVALRQRSRRDQLRVVAGAKVVRDDHTIANVMVFDSTADAVNVADAFIAHDPAGLGVTVKAVLDRQICAADGSRAEAERCPFH